MKCSEAFRLARLEKPSQADARALTGTEPHATSAPLGVEYGN
jgi:hypothetical protein